jgi:hypothetical protein
MSKKNRFQPVVSSPPTLSTENKPYLTAGGLEFYKLGGFTVAEMIAYELMANNASQHLVDIMVLAQDIAHDLGWNYGQAIEALNSVGTTITPELVGYARQVQEIGLLDFSDTRRKLDTTHQFIILRGYPDWTYEQSEKLLMSELQAIYDFMMQEFYEWKPQPIATEPADMGKPLPDSAASWPPTLEPIGENVATTSKPLESVTLDSMPSTLISN